MQERNQGGQPRVNLIQTHHEVEGTKLEVPPDVGESLMMRRAMVIPEKEKTQAKSFDGSWLRTNIFRTRCTLGGKVCQVIVDGGSCENMVSKEIVEKSNLHYEKHPHPYRIAWFKREMKSLLIKDA